MARRSGPEARPLAQGRECRTGAAELAGYAGEFLPLCGTDSVEQFLQPLPFSQLLGQILSEQKGERLTLGKDDSVIVIAGD